MKYISANKSSNDIVIGKNTSGNFIAGLILYRYILKKFNMPLRQLEEFAHINSNSVTAYFVDLNDDGKSEILGVVSAAYYMNTEGYKLFILQKNGKEYKDLSSLYILPQEGFLISASKINGYKEIEMKAYSNREYLKGKYTIIPVYAMWDGEKYTYNYPKMKIYR
jgi:hypothetical protein